MRAPRVLIIPFIVLISCAGAGHGGPATTDGPARDSYPEARYLKATGLGRTEGEARSQAVAELSRIFESRVKSEALDRVRTVSRVSPEKADETTEQWLDSRVQVVTSVELKGVEIAETWREGSTYYALAVLDRRKARDGWLREMQNIDERIRGRLDAAEALGSRLMRYRGLREAAGMWVEREVLAGRVRVLGFGEGGSPPYDMKEVFREMAVLKSRMPVFIAVEGEHASVFRDRVAGALANAGFVVTGDSGQAAVVVRGKAEIFPVEPAPPGWKYARARAALRAMDADGGLTVCEVSVERRSSHLNFREAAARALRSAIEEAAERLVGCEEGRGDSAPE